MTTNTTNLSVLRALEKARHGLGGVTTDECCGDNLAIALCTYFDDAGEVDESGWSPATCWAHTKMLDAIHAHYESILRAALSVAFPEEPPKKGDG